MHHDPMREGSWIIDREMKHPKKTHLETHHKPHPLNERVEHHQVYHLFILLAPLLMI